MGKLGISIYPEKSTFEQDLAYLQKAAKLGYKRVFTSLLQVYNQDVDTVLNPLITIVKAAKELDFEVFVDVSGHVFKALNKSIKDDLSFFKEMGVDGLRLDMGFTGYEEALMSHNPFGLKIEINMSQSTHQLDKILDFHPNKNQLIGSHNFYPQKYTGLDLNFFKECSHRFKNAGLNTQAFITSHHANLGPWILQEGLCTLEMHRTMRVANQVRHLKAMGFIDDIVFGNAYASDEELREAAAAFSESYLVLDVVATPQMRDIERLIIEEPVHMYRGDVSSYVVRSSMPRFTYRDHAIAPHQHCTDIKSGAILIMNDDYGQYKGELQIARLSRTGDTRINCVANLTPDAHNLFELLAPNQMFKLNIVQEKQEETL